MYPEASAVNVPQSKNAHTLRCSPSPTNTGSNNTHKQQEQSGGCEGDEYEDTTCLYARTSAPRVLCDKELGLPPLFVMPEHTNRRSSEQQVDCQAPRNCSSKCEQQTMAASKSVVVSGTVDARVHEHPESLCACGSTCTPCMLNCESMLLGESGEVVAAMYAALQGVLDVHKSDELMHVEFWGPFWELTEV